MLCQHLCEGCLTATYVSRNDDVHYLKLRL
nr:MAG TPA: hypothetical protein [Caudoviricetes sp.]